MFIRYIRNVYTFVYTHFMAFFTLMLIFELSCQPAVPVMVTLLPGIGLCPTPMLRNLNNLNGIRTMCYAYKKYCPLLCSLLLGLLICSGAMANTIRYVKATGTGSGTSWANASKDLQAMINASSPGDEVWVAAGTYKPSANSLIASFNLKEGVIILGGFPNINTPLLKDRDYTTNITILSGDLNGDDGPDFTNISDNSYHVVQSPGNLTNAARLDGFVIRGGNANIPTDKENPDPDVDGGGLYNIGGSPTIANCSFQGNKASYGGAIGNRYGGTPVVLNCSFQGNQAGYGGAIGMRDNSNCIVINSNFQGNNASIWGGAIYLNGNIYSATNCSFIGNEASSGGAIYHNTNSNPICAQITNCSFLNNKVSNVGLDNGSAIYNYSANPSLINCIFFGNGGNTTIKNFQNSTVTARYTLFEVGEQDFIADATNFTTATTPFTSTSSVALAPCSPAINAGSPASQTAVSGPYSETAVPATDLAGQPRIANGRIDLGAVEYQSTANIPLGIVKQPVAGSIVCAGSTVVMSVSVTGSASAYQWYNSGTALSGIASATTASLTLSAVQVSQAGIYSAVVTGNCPAVTSTAFSLTVNPLPSVSVTAAPSATLTCTNTSLTLTAQTSATAVIWNRGGSTALTLPVNQTGTYSVTATGANGCTAVSNSTSVSQDNTSPSVSVTGLSNTLSCLQPQLSLTATSSVTALHWSTGESTTTISVTNTGTYSVTARGPNGCTAVSNGLTINENFSLPPFTVSSATVCPGVVVSLSASGCTGQVRWSTNATGAVLTLTAVSNTSLLTATCTTGVCSTTAAGALTVSGIQPPPASIISFTADESACPVRLTGRGVASTFTMTGAQGYVFSTIFREGGMHDAVGLNVTRSGVYTLTTTYTTSCGTSVPVSQSVTVGRSCP